MRIDHWLYKIVPRYFCDIKWYEIHKYILWAMAGNQEDGIFGEEISSGRPWLSQWGAKLEDNIEFHPGEITFWRFVRWQIRNPLHNFMFYVIGITWMKNISQTTVINTGKIPNVVPSVWPQGDEGLAIVLRAKVLPFISFRKVIGSRRLETYAGWRERGNFGLAFRLKKVRS